VNLDLVHLPNRAHAIWTRLRYRIFLLTLGYQHLHHMEYHLSKDGTLLMLYHLAVTSVKHADAGIPLLSTQPPSYSVTPMRRMVNISAVMTLLLRHAVSH